MRGMIGQPRVGVPKRGMPKGTPRGSAHGGGEGSPRLYITGVQTVSEGAIDTTVIFTLGVSHPELLTGTPVFAISGTDSALVVIDSGTGVVTKDGDIDYDAPKHSLILIGSVSGITPAVGNMNIEIPVTDIDEGTHAPSILLVDGVSHLLLADGSSYLLRA